MRVTRSLALLLLVTAAQAAAAAAAGATLYGLNMIGNGPTRGALASIDPSTGNVTMVSGAQLPADSGTDDCRAIDSKRGLYYYLGDTHAGTTLVGLSLQTGTPKCQSTVPLKEIGFVGIGQSLKYDATRDRLILTGLVGNSTGGVSHQILTADLGSHLTAAAAAVAAAAAAAPSCATFTKAGTFPLAEQEPMLHSTAYDEKAQMLYTTIVPAKGEYALAVVDLQKQEMLRVELEGSPPVDEMTGMSWDIVTQSLIGTMQDGHNINLLSLDPSKLSVSLKGQWTVRQLLAPPKYVAMSSSLSFLKSVG